MLVVLQVQLAMYTCSVTISLSLYTYLSVKSDRAFEEQQCPVDRGGVISFHIKQLWSYWKWWYVVLYRITLNVLSCYGHSIVYWSTTSWSNDKKRRLYKCVKYIVKRIIIRIIYNYYKNYSYTIGIIELTNIEILRDYNCGLSKQVIRWSICAYM